MLAEVRFGRSDGEIFIKFEFLLTGKGCLLKVHFSRHGDVTLRLAVEPKSKKVIDLWNEGEHNRSSRLKKTTGSTVNKVSRTEKSC